MSEHIKVKLPESELKVMEWIWKEKETTARATSEYMLETYGWKKNTTYTVLGNLEGKGVISRQDPGFICRPLILKEEAAKAEAETILDRFFEGSVSAMFSSFLGESKISRGELSRIRDMIDQYEQSEAETSEEPEEPGASGKSRAKNSKRESE